MRTALLALAIGALAVGCKKKDPEPAPVAAAPAPAVGWAWGPATFDGSRAEGNTGALKVPFTATNNSDSGFQLKVVAVNIFKDGEKVCGSKVTVDGKAAQGASVKGLVEIPCEYKQLPEGASLTGKATVMYMIGADEKEDVGVAIDIPFTR